MKEIDELSSGIERLKKNSDSQKRLIEQLQKDRAFLIERTRFLGQKLGEAYVIYEEAGKRILDFVDKETAPIKNQIAELKAETGKISAMQQELKIHSSYLSKVRSGDETLKARLLETENAIKKLSEMAALAKTHIDRLREKEAKEDQALESRLADIKGHFETQLKTSQERMGLRISEASEEVLQDATDSINALAGSHEELRKHLSQTSLFVKQLKVSTASIKKQLESAGFSRAEIEKRVSGHQASIKALDSSLSKLTRRLDSINLEDEKLEKRLAELRKGAEESISSKVGQLKVHVDSHQKRQAELLDGKIGRIENRISEVRKEAEDMVVSKAEHLNARVDAYQKRQDEMLAARLKAVSEDFAARVAKINERLLAERKQMGDMESLINGKIRDSEKNAHLIKNELEKRLSLHQGSIREIDSAISKMARRLEGINLEDEKLEKRLAELRRSAEESIISKVGQLKVHVDSHEKNAEEKLSSRISSANDLLESRISGLSGTLDEKVAKINERLAGERQELSSRIERQSAAFAKLAKDQHASFESAKAEIEKRVASARANLDETLDSKASQIKAHLVSHQSKQDELVGTKLKALSDDFAGKIAKINERLLTERKQMGDIESLINGKIRDSEKNTHLIKGELEKRLSLHQGSIREIDSAISKMARRLEGINLEDEKLEKRLAELRRSAEESISSKVGQLKVHVDSHEKNAEEKLSSRISSANEMLESKIAGLSGTLDEKVAKINERLAGERQELSSRIERQSAAFAKLAKDQHASFESAKAEIEKRVASARANLDETLDSKASQIKAHLVSHQSKQDELVGTKLKALSDDFAGKMVKINERLAKERQDISDVESLINGKVAEAHKAVSLREAALEKKIADVRDGAEEMIGSREEQLKSHLDAGHKRQTELIETRLKAAEESADRRIDRLKSHIELSGQKQAQLIETRLKPIAEFEKRISEVRKSAEESIGSKVGQLKVHVDSHQKKQAELLDARLKSVSEDFAARVAKINERLAGERQDISEIESLINDRIKGSQGTFDAKLAESYNQLQNRISHVISHVASEKKAIGVVKASLEREIREEQKALSARMNALSEKSWKRVSSLSDEVSAEKKALLEKVKSLESGLRDSSLAISGLKKQLAAAGSSKASADKRISGLEARLKELQATDSGIGSRIERQHVDFQNVVKEQAKNAEFRSDVDKRLSGQQEYVKGLESALARVVKMIENVNFEDKRLEARFSEAKEEMLSKLSEENRQMHQKTGKVSSVQEETAKRLEAMENSLRVLAEKAAQSEKQFRLDMDGLKAQLAEAGKDLSKTGVRSAELKDYMSSMVKAEQDSAGAEISRLRGEIAVLKKDITEWQQEQARLYDLLKED